MKDQLELYNWLFHKGLDGNWAAIPKDKIVNYFNDYNCEGIIRSSKIEIVIELAIKVTNNPDFLKNIG